MLTSACPKLDVRQFAISAAAILAIQGVDRRLTVFGMVLVLCLYVSCLESLANPVRELDETQQQFIPRLRDSNIVRSSPPLRPRGG